MRHLFVTNAVQDEQGNVLRGWTGNAFATRAAAVANSSPITDLLDAGSTPATSLSTDAFGNVVFYGPDDIGAVWLNFGYGAWFVQAADLADRVATNEATLAQVAGQPKIVRSNNLPTDTTVIWLADPNAPTSA